MKIRDYIRNHVIVTDGAMGTYYGSLFSQDEILVEKENQRNPKRVKEIHLAYLNAGANLIRTNTFATNRNFFPDAGEVRRNIAAAYTIAKEAVAEYDGAEPVFIAADIGTIHDLMGAGEPDVLSEYRQIIDAFLEQGAEIFLFETQADLYYIRPLVSYIKEKCPAAYVMVSFSFDKTGFTKAGTSFSRMVDVMGSAEEVDAYGLNCGMEGLHMYQMLKDVVFPNEKPLIALPNAGYPFVLRGKTIYGKNEAYFLQMEQKLLSLGVDIIGGCCGTTPSYIEGTKALVVQGKKAAKRVLAAADAPEGAHTVFPKEETHSSFSKKLSHGEKPIVVELDPPSDIQVERLLSGARMLKERRVDLLTLSDSPMARSRMDASLLGSLIQREIGITVMPHMSCRDRNIISLRGTLLGDYINDLRHFLFVTGDPVAKYDRSSITQVFDYNSVKFMGLVQEMNEEQFAKEPVLYGGALNYQGSNIEAIVRRIKEKMERGCSFFLTQPVYSKEDVERIAQLRQMTGAKIIGGIMPLVSRKNALFIANEMPGISVPQELTEAYREDMTRKEAEETALKIAVETGSRMGPVTDGFYFMTPFNRVSLICSIIDAFRENNIL